MKLLKRSRSFFHAASLLALTAAAGGLHAQTLQPMSDAEMGEVTGREGVLVSIDYYYNSEYTGDLATNGQAHSSCSTPNGGTSLGDLDCRLALQLENRETEWLVFKNGHASLSIDRLSLDAAFLGDATSAGAGYTGFFDASKFQDNLGGCLLETGSCTVATLQAMPAVRAHYPLTGGSYNSTTKETTGYTDVLFGLYFEGVAVEYNTGAVQDGWQKNDMGSFLGLNIADNNGSQARIAFGGDFYMYGF